MVCVSLCRLVEELTGLTGSYPCIERTRSLFSDSGVRDTPYNVVLLAYRWLQRRTTPAP